MVYDLYWTEEVMEEVESDYGGQVAARLEEVLEGKSSGNDAAEV